MAKRQQSGGARIKAAGRRAVWVAPTLAEHAILRTAAAVCDVSLAEFVTAHAVRAARAVLKKKSPADLDNDCLSR